MAESYQRVSSKRSGRGGTGSNTVSSPFHSFRVRYREAIENRPVPRVRSFKDMSEEEKQEMIKGYTR
jgi:hypothetical protein